MSKRILALLVWVVVLLSIRLVGLADYPLIHPDEGFWTQGARNLIRHGEPLRDGRLHPFLCPGHFAELSLFFSVGPASLLGGRLFSALMGTATCLLMAILAYRSLPRRPWLLIAFFGLSTFTILIQRLALLEADQMFWMVLAALCYLASFPASALAAGLAFGMALLVKSNSLYLLPAFLIATPSGRRLSAFAQFGLGCAFLAGGGYLLAWSIDPVLFRRAFHFELANQKFELANYWFRFGRFGINPSQMQEVFLSLITGEPLLTVLGVAGFVWLLRKRSEATQADIFFGAWLVLGLCFHFPQIFVEHRYLTTLAPAFAYLSARLVDAWLANAAPEKLDSRRALAAGLLVAFVAFHGFRLAYGIGRDLNHDYWAMVDHVSRTIPHDARVLAASDVVQSLPQDGFDFYRMLTTYDRTQPNKPLARLVAEVGATALVVDDEEWPAYLSEADRAFLRDRCTPPRRFGIFEVYEVVSRP